MAKPFGPPQVALLIETSNAYARGLLRGIRNYVLVHGPWSIYLGEQRRGEPAPQWLAKWRGDGIIARIETQPIARVIESLHIPTVDVSAARHLQKVPFVETNDPAIARLAGEHLRERGFQRLAFCGDARFRWSQNRETAFRDFAAEHGLTYFPFKSKARGGHRDVWQKERAELAAWIQSLPRPVGILATYDIRGRQILDTCRELGISVPEEIAVIGVDNDELICDFSSPSLTSVQPDSVRTGYEAAALLDRLMQGEKVDQREWLIEPLGVVTRGSTDVLAIEDSDVTTVLRYIREHAREPMRVEELLSLTSLSRRQLEARFKKWLGRTPHEEMERVRIEYVKRLLLETDLTLSNVALRAGFQHIEYMCVAFKRATGLPPGKFRQRHFG
jgi:LacI family transcriptional regulator